MFGDVKVSTYRYMWRSSLLSDRTPLCTDRLLEVCGEGASPGPLVRPKRQHFRILWNGASPKQGEERQFRGFSLANGAGLCPQTWHAVFYRALWAAHPPDNSCRLGLGSGQEQMERAGQVEVARDSLAEAPQR